MLWGIVRRVQLWRRGQPEFGLDRPIQRIARVLKYAVGQVKIMWQRYPGVFHFALFWGMVLLFIGTVLATIDSDVFELFFDAKLLLGHFYVFYKVVLDLAGLGFLIGLGMALYRRYIVRPPRLNIDWRFNFTLPLLGFIIITGFLIGALRLAVMDPPGARRRSSRIPSAGFFRAPRPRPAGRASVDVDHPLPASLASSSPRCPTPTSSTSSPRRPTSSLRRSASSGALWPIRGPGAG